MPISAVDLFCGVGGLTHGLQLSGIPVVAGLDVEHSFSRQIHFLWCTILLNQL